MNLGSTSALESTWFQERPGDSSKHQFIKQIVQQDRTSVLERAANKARLQENLEKENRAQDLARKQTRKWKAGDVYAPHDLSAAEMKKWRQRQQSTMDAFDALAINPLDEYKVECPSHK